MTPEQTFALTVEDNPVYMPGVYYIVSSLYKDQRKVAEAIKSGKGFGWHEHHNDLFIGTKKFFRPGYIANLVNSWLPSLEGVVPKLQAGGRVADVGCGLGASTIIMAKAFPKSKFIGFDYHLESIEWAQNDAVTQGVTPNTDFEMATAKEYRGKDYDLVTFFDCLHDMGDPVGAAQHALKSLKPDGTLMVVEPFAKDQRRTEPQSNRADLLRSVVPDLRSGFPVARGREGLGSSGQRCRTEPCLPRRRIHADENGYRDAVQSSFRSPPIRGSVELVRNLSPTLRLGRRSRPGGPVVIASRFRWGCFVTAN